MLPKIALCFWRFNTICSGRHKNARSPMSISNSVRFFGLVLPFFSRFRTMASEAHQHQFYQLKPLQLGAEVTGISLQADPPAEVIQQIKADVTKHRILIFRDQGDISGKRHVEISRWFGELDSTFYRHPRSPDLDVFRVSNDRNEGCTGVGRTGWHIDGSFQTAPFSYSLYHIVSVPEKGDTGNIYVYTQRQPSYSDS